MIPRGAGEEEEKNEEGVGGGGVGGGDNSIFPGVLIYGISKGLRV